MIKKLVSIAFLAFVSSVVMAQEDTLQTKKSLYRGYTGGMMVHMGYGSGGVLTPVGAANGIGVNGIASGIGGRIVVQLGDNLRVGTEGYVTTINYGEHRNADLGWGGLTADYGWQIGKFRPYFGLSIGGGSYENQCAISPITNNNQPEEVVWHKYAVFLLTPYAAVEYKITPKLAVMARLDWITSPTANKGDFNDFSSGPRLHIGMMFSH